MFSFLLLTSSVVTLSNAAPPADPDDLVHVRGRVTDPSNKPLAGATILAIGDWWTFDAPLAQSKSNPDGSYDITFRKSQYDAVNSAWQSTAIVAIVPGFGPDWKLWNDRGADGATNLALPPDDIPLTGRLLDLEGNPVKNAKVKVDTVAITAPDLNSLPISGRDPLEVGGNYRPDLPGYVLGPSQSVTTQPDGSFHIPGVGRDRTAVLSFVGPGIAHTSAKFQTRNVPTQTRTFQPIMAAIAAGPSIVTIYGANGSIAAEPGRTVTGTVTDAETHAPLPGVILKTMPLSLKALTDKDGRYRLEGIPKKKGFSLGAAPPEDQPYFVDQRDIPPDLGLAPITLDFQLHRGLWITGKITDKITGKPVHTRVNYLPYLTNPYARALPEFRDQQTPNDVGVCYTKADGSFRLVGLPGPALVVAWWSKEPYLHGVGVEKVKCPTYNSRQYQVYAPVQATIGLINSVAEIDLPQGAQDSAVNLQLDPGVTVRMQTLDPAGNPLQGVAISPAPPGSSTLDRRDSSTFDAVALKPGEQRDFFFRDDAHQLGKAIVVTAPQTAEQDLKVNLQPLATFTGRLIGPDGLPLAGARIDAWTPLCSSSTDADGCFTITILPGHDSELFAVKGRAHFATDAKKFKVTPGETRDLGDVHAKPF